MGHIYLVRHGRPEFHNNETRCIGLTDVPLSEEGRGEIRALAGQIPAISRIYASPLARARESAELLSLGKTPVYTLDSLHELRMGTWENLTFDEIRARYPEEYARRGDNMADFAPTCGESFRECQRRAVRALRIVLDDSAGENVAIVAHAGFNRALISALEDRPLAELFSIKLGYASVYGFDGGTVFRAREGEAEVPSRERAGNLLSFFVADEGLVSHSEAVAEKALRMAEEIRGKVPLDTGLVYAAALLHDIKKGSANHGRAGAEALGALGYERVAMAMRDHDRLAFDEARGVDEALIVFLADKLISGTEPCSLEARYGARMREYAADENALSAIKRRYCEAERAMELYNLVRTGQAHNI